MPITNRVGRFQFDSMVDATGQSFVMRTDAMRGVQTLHDSRAEASEGVPTDKVPVEPLTPPGASPAATMLSPADVVQTIQPLPGSWENVRDKSGPAASNVIFPGKINRPSALARAPSGGILIASYYDQPLVMNPVTGVIEGELPILYQRPSESNTGFAYTFAASYSPSGTKLALGSQTDDVVRVYDVATGALLSQVGNSDAAGAPHLGDVQDVYGDCLWINETTLAVPSYTGTHAPVGQTAAGSNLGSVSIWDVSTASATFQRYALWPSATITPAAGSSHFTRPMDIKPDPDTPGAAYIACYNHGVICRIADVTADPWVVDEVFYAPMDLTAGGNVASFANPYGFDVSGGELVVAPHQRDIFAIDIATGQKAWSVAKSSFGVTGDWRSITFVDDDFALVADWGAAAAVLIPRNNDLTVPLGPLTIPDGMTLDRAANGTPGTLNADDPTAPTLTVSVADAARVGPVDVLLKQA